MQPGKPRQPAGRLQGQRQELEELKTAAPAAYPLHVTAAARAGGHVHEEQIPGPEHERGDRHLDEHHGAQSQGE